MNNLKEEFQTTEDVSLVVNTNSDVMYDGRDYSASTVPAAYKDFAFAKGAKAGDFTGLQFANGTYSMARIMKAGYSLPDSVELKGIASQEGQEDAEQAAAWLRERGVETEPIREDPVNGGRMTFFRDPDGLPLELHE